MTNDGTWTYTWEHGRELATMASGDTTWTFTYNADGMRTKRTNGSTTYSYVYNGSSLSQMSVGTHLLNFAYDASGAPMAVTYDGTTYYYVTNLQGDIIAILDSTGTAVVQYSYDAWGKLLTTTGSMATTLGAHNPLRYRGYVYDNEYELYYLQSRYYDPEVGRFISADAFTSTGQGILGNNMFAYCGNNPVMGYDPAGYFSLAGAIIVTGAIVGGLLGAFPAVTTGGNVLESTIEGCLTGVIGAACGLTYSNPLIAAGIAFVCSAVVDIGTQVTTQYLTTQKVDVREISLWRAAKVGLETGIGAAIPAFGEGAGNAVDAFGTALTWAEASTLITCVDVAVTNTIATIQSSTQSTSTNPRGVAIRGQEMLLR